MLKITSTDIDAFHGEPIVSIIDLNDVGGLTKSASDGAISEFASKITPDPNKVYVHILAMGAGEYWGGNRNADFFPEENLIRDHETFMTSPAHVFRNHVNKDPSIAIGQVVFSVYNHRMHRVELIAWIDRSRGADVIERIERGEFPATSMACKTPYDVCAVCGNKASTRQEYCEHLTNDLGRMYPDGRKAMALNVAPLRFFDISIVVRPADVTSSVLQKVASADDHVIGSAEQAEVEGLVEKAAAHKKLSEFIKEIDGGVTIDWSENLDKILSKVQDPSRDLIPELNQHSLGDVLHTMAHLGISPSVAFLADLIGHRMAGDGGIGVGELVAGHIGASGLEGMDLPEGGFAEAKPNSLIAGMLAPHVKQASLYPDYVAHRALAGALPGTNVGYIGNGPHIELTPEEKYRALMGHPESKSSIMSMIKTLVTIGGAALAAKWYITKVIEQKMQEQASHQQPAIKIVLVKSATDYRSTYRLAKAAMVKSLGK